MKPTVRTAKFSTIGVAVLFGVGTFVSASASAQVPSDRWQYRASIYGCLPDLSGSTNFPAGAGSSISVDADKIISNLKFAFTGSFEAQKGRWGAFNDVMYLNLGSSKSGTRDLTIGGTPYPPVLLPTLRSTSRGWYGSWRGTTARCRVRK